MSCVQPEPDDFAQSSAAAKADAQCEPSSDQPCPIAVYEYAKATLTITSVEPDLAWHLRRADGPGYEGADTPGYDLRFGAEGTSVRSHPFFAQASGYQDLQDAGEQELVRTKLKHLWAHFGLELMDDANRRMPDETLAEFLPNATWPRLVILGRQTYGRLGMKTREFILSDERDRDRADELLDLYMTQITKTLKEGKDLCDARGALVAAVGADSYTAFLAATWDPPQDDGNHHVRGLQPFFTPSVHQAIIDSPLDEDGDTPKLYREMMDADCPVQDWAL